MSAVEIKSHKKQDMLSFLKMKDFEVEDLGQQIYKVTRSNELPVFLKVVEDTIFFEMDLGQIASIGSKDLYFKLLDLNTEILPVSFGIDNTNNDDPRLILVESRPAVDLCEHELLQVFDAMELATDKAEKLLTPLLNI